MLNEPKDFLGAMIGKMITSHLSTEVDVSELKSWNMTVIVRTDFYDISLQFKDGVTLTTGAAADPTLIAITTFHTLLQILKGRTTLLQSFIRGHVRLKGLIRHPLAALRFYRLINSLLSR